MEDTTSKTFRDRDRGKDMIRNQSEEFKEYAESLSRVSFVSEKRDTFKQNKGRKYIKTVLRHLESTSISDYLATKQQKQSLKYPAHNIPNDHYKPTYELVSIDCQMLNTTNGPEIIRIVIINSIYNILYDSWFRPKGQIIDYVTHITGVTKQNFQYKKFIELNEEIEKINMILEDKVIVGHDLANDLAVLPIKNRLFIDTVLLYPHNLGMPYKQSLKSLALEYLNRPIQWGSHDPFEDAKASLDLALILIKKGRGVVTHVEATVPIQHYSIAQLLQQAQLSYECIQGFFLRGSRALGIEIDEQGEKYLSDWDYYCVYNTSTTINGRLIKLYNTDITIYDTVTFNGLLNEVNDIPALQLFFLPKQYQYINKLSYPQIHMNLLRQSLGFHLSKCKLKIKRFKQTIQEKNILQWKILKSMHLQARFLEYFIQFKESNKIDIMKSNQVWQEVRCRMKQGSYKAAETFLADTIKQKYEIVRKIQPSAKSLRNKELNEKITHKLGTQTKTHINQCYFKEVEQHQEVNSLRLQLVSILLKQGLQSIQKYRISYHRHQLYPNLIQFHYLQSADFSHQICRESRGIILDQSSNYKIVSLPYFKFFDYNDPKNSQLKQFDWSQFKIYKKYDGSIAMMYSYRQQWWISSSRVPDGSNSYCFGRLQTTTQFRKQFWKIFHTLGYRLPELEDTEVTFIFQILSKDHIIVARRSSSDLILHGAFNRINGQQLDHQQLARKYSYRSAEDVAIEPRNLQSIVKAAESLSPLKEQGYVVCDKNGLRMKIKSTAYVKANYLAQSNLGQLKNPQRYILTEIVLKGDQESFLGYCPQWKPMIDDLTAKIRFINEESERIYSTISNLPSKERSRIIQEQAEYLRPFIYSLSTDYHRWHNKLQFLMTPKKLYKYLIQVKAVQPQQIN